MEEAGERVKADDDYLGFTKWLNSFMDKSSDKTLPARVYSQVETGIVVAFVNDPEKPVSFMSQKLFAQIMQTDGIIPW